jgi:hypothetical protein
LFDNLPVGLANLPQHGGKFGCFYIETIPEAVGFLNSSISSGWRLKTRPGNCLWQFPGAAAGARARDSSGKPGGFA